MSGERPPRKNVFERLSSQDSFTGIHKRSSRDDSHVPRKSISRNQRQQSKRGEKPRRSSANVGNRGSQQAWVEQQVRPVRRHDPLKAAKDASENLKAANDASQKQKAGFKVIQDPKTGKFIIETEPKPEPALPEPSSPSSSEPEIIVEESGKGNPFEPSGDESSSADEKEFNKDTVVASLKASLQQKRNSVSDSRVALEPSELRQGRHEHAMSVESIPPPPPGEDAEPVAAIPEDPFEPSDADSDDAERPPPPNEEPPPINPAEDDSNPFNIVQAATPSDPAGSEAEPGAVPPPVPKRLWDDSADKPKKPLPSLPPKPKPKPKPVAKPAVVKAQPTNPAAMATPPMQPRGSHIEATVTPSSPSVSVSVVSPLATAIDDKMFLPAPNLRTRGESVLQQAQREVEEKITADGMPPVTFVDLRHQFPLVSKQVENGLYAAKRVVAYLKKVVGQEDSYHREITRITQHEGTKRTQTDGMRQFAQAWSGVHRLFHGHAELHAQFKQQIATKVMLPIQEFQKEADVKLAECMTNMKAMQKHIKAVMNDVKKTKKEALSKLQSLKSAKESSSGDSTQQKSGMFAKISSKLQKRAAEQIPALTEKAGAACQAYLTAIQRGNIERNKYMEQQLPLLFQELYKLELARLNVMKRYMGELVNLYRHIAAPMLQLADDLQQQLLPFEPYNDIGQFVQSWIEVHGEAPKVVPYRYDLPCTADELHKGRWDGSLDLKAHDSIFNTTLEEVMKLQKEQFPDATEPMILTTLLEAIERLGGHETQGIFRISANKTALDALHIQLDKGDYKVECDSPHVPAGVLKEWLREMEEPLIPASMYAPCIETMKQIDKNNSDVSASKLLKVFEQLPPLTQTVTKRLATVLKKIVANKDVTMMGVDNLAIVFSPSFLRCESEDPMEMMTNAKYETKFVKLLFDALMETSS